MSSQRSRAPRGGARVGPQDIGEEAQLWNETLEKLMKLQQNEAQAKELTNEILEKEASMEDAGTSKVPYSLIRCLLTADRAIY